MAASLNNQDVSEMKKMIMKGYVPRDIMDRFGCAISTVHYYKNKLQEEGKNVPDVKGKRPSGEFKGKRYVSPTASYQSPSNQESSAGKAGGQVAYQPQTHHVQNGIYGNGQQFKVMKVNGIVIEYDPNAKSVKVHPDGSFEVIF